jgi:hypothetical protein
MKQTIEIPDLELNPKNYPNDRLRIFIRKDYWLLQVSIDGAGNEFKITKEMLEKLK